MDVHFAICADRNIEAGLHVTLYSALDSLPADSRAVAHLFLKDYGETQIDSLRKTALPFKDRFEMHTYDVDKIDLGNGRGIHGNRMTYVRIFISDLIETERVIYLDSDLLIASDLSVLFNWNLNGAAVAAVSHTKVRDTWSKERAFLSGVGVSGDSSYFNAGVLVIDVEKWKEQDITKRCVQFIAENSDQLVVADQTVLNSLLSGQVSLLPEKYNVLCYPTNSVFTNPEDSIYHFVGSPKPWDVMGEFIHESYPAFKTYLELTDCRHYRSYRDLNWFKLSRTMKLAGSYYRILSSRFRKGWKQN